MRRRAWLIAALAPVTASALGGSASAATCEGYKGVTNHGEHVIVDYVLGAVDGGPITGEWPPTGIGSLVGETGGAIVPGGPGPGFHFEVGAAPGASFCIDQARSGGR